MGGGVGGGGVVGGGVWGGPHFADWEKRRRVFEWKKKKKVPSLWKSGKKGESISKGIMKKREGEKGRGADRREKGTHAGCQNLLLEVTKSTINGYLRLRPGL